MADIGNLLCQAAAEGNVQHLERLYNAGVDINKTDYDGRSALNVAAGEGHASTVEFLLKHGARVNNSDRFGNTPLSDASRSRAKHKHVVMQLLITHGAQLESSEWELRYDPLLQGSILRSLHFLLQRANAVYVEAWLPNEDEREFQLFESTTSRDKSVPSIAAFTSAPADATYANSPANLMGKCWATKEPVVFSDITERDLPQRYRQAKEAGLRSGVIIPVLHNDKPFALFKLFSTEPVKLSREQLMELTHFAGGIVTAGMYRKGKYPTFSHAPAHLPRQQMVEVYTMLVNEEVFSANLVYQEVDWFYNLGLQKYYLDRFASSEIANHIHAFIAAKKVAATTGKPEDISLSIESKSVDGSPSWLYMCPIEHDRQVEVEKRVQGQIMKLSLPSLNKSYTLEFFMSLRPIVPSGSKQMGLYVLESSDWNAPAVSTQPNRENVSNIEEVASLTFLRTKSAAIKARYQDLLASTVNKLSPVAQVYDVYRDGTTPIMFSFYHAAGTTTSYMLQLTELLKGNNLVANRKFIETFANGVVVYSLYLNAAPPGAVDSLLKQFSMLHLVPESTLTARFLSGEYSAQQYTYYSAASRFVYYFLKGRSEEFDVLAKSLKNDPLNLGRLRLLQTRLKREAVSQERINACIANHPAVVADLFADFYRIATTADPAKVEGKVPQLNADILNKIKHESTAMLDQQILIALLSFNAHLLKTNFYNKQKASLSFRLDPRFLQDSDWPVVPFGLFFVMGSDFQGFHVRFSDIARGGIRMIFSSDRQAYNTNLETLFQENYGLAFTQNKKNKDIPEFGSKGTILLNLTNQTKANALLAFKKYTSGLLDLLIPQQGEIIDNYGREEILFLGPDEGTADYMEWAARYAAKRGYQYWRSFTTGKPSTLGGIPHDIYGMTTRSVHTYVLGCLKEMGLKEEEVTKFQTGGPDGDLGSNELLISKDRTTAIVDGSGVVYDPKGLDRKELHRLARKRVTVKEFDLSKLSADGFRVLTSDKNVRLPNGDVVDSGTEFRNEFHLNPLSSADLFVPCGGRPESVNLTNVARLFNAKGRPRYKVIVEGANLFFTQDARMVLENAGVVLYKDASANKGGVTSSSLEVLAALAIPNGEFDKHMCVREGGKLPPFYLDYVKEIQARIEADAELEFRCIWRENAKTGVPRYLLTDQVSDKINTLNHFIQHSSLWDNVQLRHTVLSHAIPRKLVELLGLDAILQRVPDTYIQAIFGAYLASRYVYKMGLDANEMAFFEFMHPFISETQQKELAKGKTSKAPVEVEVNVARGEMSGKRMEQQPVGAGTQRQGTAAVGMQAKSAAKK